MSSADNLDEMDIYRWLETRLGRLHAKQRLGIENDHEAQIFGQGINYFHIENFPPSHGLIEWALKLSGLYWRGRRRSRPGERRGGRKPGIPNKVNAELREAAAQYTTAASAVLDRGHGKPRQQLEHGGQSTAPIVIKFDAIDARA